MTTQERRKKETDVAVSAKGVNFINLDPNSDASPKCVPLFASPCFQSQFLI